MRKPPDHLQSQQNSFLMPHNQRLGVSRYTPTPPASLPELR